ncbi:MAG: hypothetical protein K9G26_00670 [Emcibacter sp.]|nr:hypothetical protein [Emcibacter sp.]
MEHENFSSLPQKKLKKLIKETENMLEELKCELDKRKTHKQHEEIDHLEEYFEDADHNLTNLKKFIQRVINEIKK